MDSSGLHFVEHGDGRPVVVLHGAGVDHRESEACFEPVLGAVPGLRRFYPDLPGTGGSALPASTRTTRDVLDQLVAFRREVAGDEPCVLVGHSLGAHYARAMAAVGPGSVRALVLVCPLLPGVRDVPEHVVVAGGEAQLGDEGFRSYFVVHTPEMLERYERFVAPAAELVDEVGLERVDRDWDLGSVTAPAYAGPTLVVAGRLDSTVGWAAATDLLTEHPRASLVVLDGAGHALPHEQPRLLTHLVNDWLAELSSTG